LVLHSTPDADAAISDRARFFVIAMPIAMLVTTLQVSPQRGLSFLHFGLFALFVGTLAHAIDPSADWPAALIGVGAGLPFAGLTTALLMHVPPKQRLAAMLIAGAVTILAALLGSCVRFLPHERIAWTLAALSLGVFGTFLRWYFREFAEFIQEWGHLPMYRFNGYGPRPWPGPTRR